MCSNPITKGNITFACTSCNDCIAARINGWVARAMAEKATSKFCYVLALTYANDTLEQRDGSKVFRYKDIKDLMKNIRRQAEYHLGGKQEVRYLACGELGSMNGRVHWHLVIFTSFDLTHLGNWFSFVSKKPVTEKKDIITVDPNKEKRLLWSLWKMGLLVVQIPDQGGMMYALKYALKDQFSLHKSKGTMRETKGEQYAAGYFRMSKAPPIGAVYVEKLLQRLREKNAVLPSLKIKIPDYTGYLFPAGYLLEQVITGFLAINNECLNETGRNVAQWSSLLQSVFEQPKIWERLAYVEEEIESDADYTRRKQAAARQAQADARRGEFRQRCGGHIPCTACLTEFSADFRKYIFELYQQDAIGLVGYAIPIEEKKFGLTARTEWGFPEAYQTDRALKVVAGNLRQAFSFRNKCHSYCGLRFTKSARNAFGPLEAEKPGLPTKGCDHM